MKAIRQYELIQPNDKIAVCISGGKDSMLMAMCMKRLVKYSEIPFEVVFLVMDPGYHEINRQKIIDNAALLDIPIKVFDTATYTVGGETQTSYMANAIGGDFDPDTEAIVDGVFAESKFRSAPYFDVQIDGITLLDTAF